MKKLRLSKLTIALIAAALILFGAGGAMGVRAQLTIFSQDYNASFGMDHLGIQILENGGQVPEDGLLTAMGGRFDPGYTYDEEIAARNNSDTDQFVRLSIRKYWIKDGKKNTSLDPALIELVYDDQAYNDGAWQINDAETTTEMKTYYYSRALKAGQDTEPIVNKLRINSEIASPEHIQVSKPKDGVITYEYEYDGYTIGIETDVQSIQTHNADDAIKSSWGVQNINVSGDKLKVE